MTHDSAPTDQPRGFPLTRHSVLVELKSEDREKRERAWESLAAAYWRPVYCHIRLRWNVDREDAQDLAQDFFLRALGGHFFDGYDPGRARFRTFLRTCLDRFLANEQRDAGREKRGGGIIFLPIDVGEVEADLLANGSSASDPDQLFHREWVRSLFTLAVDALREECAGAGKEIQFSVFERADLLPVEGAERPSYRDLAAEFELPMTQVTNYLAFARREFRRLALERLASLCGSEEEYQSEARELFGIGPP
ncbi:MAG TPA: sigma factor [Gemmatimonadales bacterium]